MTPPFRALGIPASAAGPTGEGGSLHARGGAAKRGGNPVWREPWRWRPTGRLRGVVTEPRERDEQRRVRAKAARAKGKGRVQDLRLSGKWLAALGFDLGQQYEVEVEMGRLTIRAV